MSDQELRIVAPTAIVGYGFQESSLERVLRKDPHLIACDGGSTDPGPNYLGMGKAFVGRDAAKRDLALMLQAAVDRRIPMVVGTSGGAGADAHLQWTREIVEEIAHENNLHFRMALIHSEQSREYVALKLEQDRVEPLWPLPPLRQEVIDRSSTIVGMAGVEPYIEALGEGAQVILCGRSDDAAIFAALPIKEEFDPALGWVAGKLLECGAACAVPRQKYGSEGITVTLRRRNRRDHRVENLGDSVATLRGGEDDLIVVETDDVNQFLRNALGLSGRQVNLVHHGDQCQVHLHREVDVGERLRLDALRRINDQHGTLTGRKRAGDLVREVDVARCVDQVELVLLAVDGMFHAHGLRFDRDALFALQIHLIEQLILHLASRHGAGRLDHAIGECRLAVVDVRNDREVADP